jgi:hypothetical protein
LSDLAKYAWGFSLFCDDIRAEVGGKMSVMGIYQADMVFPPSTVFPFNITKLCILVKYYEEPGKLTEDLELRVSIPGDSADKPSIVVPMPRSDVDKSGKGFPLESDQKHVVGVTVPLSLTPLRLNEPGFVKVRMRCGSIVTNLGSLMIRAADPKENLQFSA